MLSVIFFSPFFLLVIPFGALAICMPFITVAALERLAPIRQEPVLLHLSILRGPVLLTLDVIFAELYEHFSLAVENI